MKFPDPENLITVAVTLIVLVMTISLVALTFMYPLEFRTDFRQILGVVLAFYFGLKVGDNNNKPPWLGAVYLFAFHSHCLFINSHTTTKKESKLIW